MRTDTRDSILYCVSERCYYAHAPITQHVRRAPLPKFHSLLCEDGGAQACNTVSLIPWF